MLRYSLIILVYLFSTWQVYAQPVSVPFKLIDNRPFVEVEVNGLTGWFILDTGGRLGFNEDFARKAGIAKADSSTMGGAGNGTQRVWFANAMSAKLANTTIQVKSNRPYILDLNTIRDSLSLPFLDGVIGEELFRQYDVSINYPGRKITLYANNSYKTEGYKKVPFQFYQNQIPKIELKVNGINGEFTIDTGDRSYLTIFPEFYKQHQLSKELSKLKVTGYGVGGPVMAREFQLGAVEVTEGIRFVGVKTRVPDHDSGLWATNSHAGNIGGALLKDYEVIFDYDRQALYLKQPEQLTIPYFTYHAQNMDKTVAWYQKHLPFEKINSANDPVILQYQQAKIKFISKPDLPTLNEYKAKRENKVPNGVFKFGFDVPDAQALYDSLKKADDVQLMGRVINWWGTRMFLVRDPEGNVIQFFERDLRWTNSFYCFITDNQEQYVSFLKLVNELGMQEHSNFNKPSEGTNQQSFTRGNISFELLKLASRAEVPYNKIGASGIQPDDAVTSMAIQKPQPPLRHHAAGTFIPGQGIAIAGGTSADGLTGLTDLWLLDNNRNWIRSDAKLPSPRSSLMLFNTDASTYYYGGWDNNNILADLAELKNGKWVSVSENASPGNRYSSGYAYNPRIKQFVFYGGCAANRQNLSDTWIFKAGKWEKQGDNAAPGPRCRAQLAYDHMNKKMLLFGGAGSDGQTWLLDGKSWKVAQQNGPPARYNHMMVSDVKRKKIILFGGAAPGGVRFNDVWEWDGKTWKQIETKDGPSPRDMGVMVYNPENGLVYLLGGRSPKWNPIDDIWSWNGEKWILLK